MRSLRLDHPDCSPDGDCLVDEDVGFPQPLDVFRVLEENIALVAGFGAREGGLGGGQRLALRLHLLHLLLVVRQPRVIPVHPAG